MPIQYEYGIYDLDGNMVFKGNSNAIIDKYNVSVSSLYHYAVNGIKMKRKYRVKRLGIYVAPKEEKVKVKPKEQTYLEYVIKHLEEYGNVYSRVNPEKYLSQLKELGYDCDYKQYQASIRDDFILDANKKQYLTKKKEYVTDYVIYVR